MLRLAQERVVFLSLAILLTFAASSLCTAQARTVIDFEDLPTGKIVTSQYRAKGVFFLGVQVAADRRARSGSQVLFSTPAAAEIFVAPPLVISFRRPQSSVSLHASATSATPGTLTAFDRSGRVVVSDGSKPVSDTAFDAKFSVATEAPKIWRVELSLVGAARFAIDDLEFDDAVGSARPLVQTKELRQRSAAINPGVAGKLSRDFFLRPVAVADSGAGVSPDNSTGEDEDETEEEESEAFSELPVIFGDLGPGKSASFDLNIATLSSTLSTSVRWAGTNKPLDVKLLQNGATLAVGKAHALGKDRGGATLSARPPQIGVATLSIKNSTGAAVNLRIALGVHDASGR